MIIGAFFLLKILFHKEEMKTKLFLIIVFSIFNASLYSQTAYFNKSSNYSFSIPVGWKQKPQSEVNNFSKHTGQNYDAVFTPNVKASDDWGPPLIFSIFKNKTLKKEDYKPMANEFIKLFKKILVPYSMENYNDLINSVRPGEAFYNEKNHCFVCSYEADVKGYGKAYYVTVGFFTPKGILSIQFADMEKDFKKSVTIFSKLLSSLKK